MKLRLTPTEEELDSLPNGTVIVVKSEADEYPMAVTKVMNTWHYREEAHTGIMLLEFLKEFESLELSVFVVYTPDWDKVLRTLFFNALIEEFSSTYQVNPEWYKRRPRYSETETDDLPYLVLRSRSELEHDSCMVSFLDKDGEVSLRSLDYTEVVEALLKKLGVGTVTEP